MIDVQHDYVGFLGFKASNKSRDMRDDINVLKEANTSRYGALLSSIIGG